MIDPDKCDYCSREVVRHSLRAIVDTEKGKVYFVCIPCHEQDTKNKKEQRDGKS